MAFGISAKGLLSILGVAAIGGFQYLDMKQLIPTQSVFVQYHSSYVDQEVEQLNTLRHMPSIGFGNFISDWGFLQFLQYFGDEESRNVNGYGMSPEYMAAV